MTNKTERDLYKDAGVDVNKGDALVDWLQTGKGSQATPYASVVSGIGGFAGLVRPQFAGMKDPLLVASTDGVGTKVLLGIEHSKLVGLGRDLVAMCVNDIYTVGAHPLFFLDYYATGSLDESQFKDVLTGIRAGLADANCILLGGETAELPGLYAHRHFDLAGFVIGVVDGAKRLGPERVKKNDVLVALPSSGFHSNGYSLVRKWLQNGRYGEDFINKVMAPTTIYGRLPAMIDRLGVETVHALANITGGGISGNLPRVLPAGNVAKISRQAIPMPTWMADFIAANDAGFADVEGVFNCGVGMIAVVARESQATVIKALEADGLTGACVIGELSQGVEGQPAEVVYVD